MLDEIAQELYLDVTSLGNLETSSDCSQFVGASGARVETISSLDDEDEVGLTTQVAIFLSQ